MLSSTDFVETMSEMPGAVARQPKEAHERDRATARGTGRSHRNGGAFQDTGV